MLTSVQQFYKQPPARGADAPRRAASRMPYTVREEAVTAGANVAYNGYAHSFAGMGIQFLLFAAIDSGIGILLERQRGLWKRLRSAPISRLTLLGGKAASGTLISLMIAAGVVRLRDGRVSACASRAACSGFSAVAVACAIMASTFGLLIAALGKTPATARGVATLAVLMMVMLGGAWVPTFIFPAWLQQLTVVVPARWAVDGLDAMTWRGLGLSGAVVPTARAARVRGGVRDDCRDAVPLGRDLSNGYMSGQGNRIEDSRNRLPQGRAADIQGR